MEPLDRLADHLWFAHAIPVDDDQIHKFANARRGTLDFPCCHMLLSSAISPIKKYLSPCLRLDLPADGPHTLGALLCVSLQPACDTTFNSRALGSVVRIESYDMRSVGATRTRNTADLAAVIRELGIAGRTSVAVRGFRLGPLRCVFQREDL